MSLLSKRAAVGARNLFSRYFSSERRSVITYQWVIILGLTLFYAPFAEPQKSDAFPYKLRWKYLVPNPLESAVSEGDSLYFVANTEGRLSALRKSDGVRIWRRRDLGPVWASPLVWEGQVIVADALFLDRHGRLG